jgi:hypothetical protein
MFAAVCGHLGRCITFVRRLTILHGERSHRLNGQGQYQQAYKGGTQPFTHEKGQEPVQTRTPDYPLRPGQRPAPGGLPPAWRQTAEMIGQPCMVT